MTRPSSPSAASEKVALQLADAINECRCRYNRPTDEFGSCSRCRWALTFLPLLAAALSAASEEAERRRTEECARLLDSMHSYDGTGCRDKAHDDRWCSSCENRNDALEEASLAILTRWPPATSEGREPKVAE